MFFGALWTRAEPDAAAKREGYVRHRGSPQRSGSAHCCLNISFVMALRRKTNKLCMRDPQGVTTSPVSVFPCPSRR